MGKKSSYHGLIVGKVEYFDFKDLLSYPVQRCKLEEIMTSTKETKKEMDSLGIIIKITEDEIFISSNK